MTVNELIHELLERAAEGHGDLPVVFDTAGYKPNTLIMAEYTAPVVSVSGRRVETTDGHTTLTRFVEVA